MNTNEQIKNGLLALYELDKAIVEIQNVISKLQMNSHIIKTSFLNARNNEDEECS